jgi:hypothetical protein
MTLERIEEKSGDAVLLHAERGEVRLSDYWKDRTSVFIFLRHFG